MTKLYAIKDSKGIGFGQPFTANNDLEALRALSDSVNREPMPGQPKSTLAEHPEDFALYSLGEFNQETGEITPETKFMENAISLKKASA